MIRSNPLTIDNLAYVQPGAQRDFLLTISDVEKERTLNKFFSQVSSLCHGESTNTGVRHSLWQMLDKEGEGRLR